MTSFAEWSERHAKRSETQGSEKASHSNDDMKDAMDEMKGTDGQDARHESTGEEIDREKGA